MRRSRRPPRRPCSPPNPRDATLEHFAARRVDRDRLIPPGAAVLAAVSGGADSVALLHWLVAERARTGRTGSVAAAHVDHGLRGAASDEDAAFVKQLAGSWGVPCFQVKLPPGALSAASAGAPDAVVPEDRARRLRYEALRDLAASAGADVIAVAHTADDQVETVLFRLARGSGLRGLGGIASRARVHGARVVRPLLDTTREQVLEYLARHDVPYREDASNANLGASRNYIRHEVIPRLQERVNPAVREALLRESALFHEADVYLEGEARRVLPEVLLGVEPGKIVLDASRLNRYPKLLRSYIFRCALHDLDGIFRELSAAHVDVLHSLATQSSGRSADFPMGVHARRERGGIILTSRKREPAGGEADSRKEASQVETTGVPADSRKGSPAE